MNTTNELRNQRARIWEQAKAFLDSHRDKNGILTAEDTDTYERMEQDIVNLGKEIDRQERLEAFERELKAPTSEPLTSKPDGAKMDMKTGRASDEYKKNFWNALRSKYPLPSVTNALQVGTDSEGGYLVPDEFERTLIEALEEENFFRRIATVIHSNSGDRKIPVVASKGTAGWIDEEGLYPESDDSFGQLSLGAYKLGTMIKISEELLNDSAFDMEGYITREFARRIGTKEEEAFFTGDGTGKPLGLLAATGGADVGVTTAGGTAITADEVIDLYYSLRIPYRNSNSVSMPKMNVNSTGAKYIVQYKNFIPSVGIWRPNQTVLFIYDGSFYVGVNLAQATTSYYGVTKLVNSVTSTATDLAAAAAAVKTAYDRNSWDSITLTNALAIAYGGTGATTTAGARTNLGLGVTLLWSGTCTTGSCAFNYGNYNWYIILGQPASNGSRTPIVVPKAALTTSAVAYQITDESYYYSFNLYYSGTTAYAAYKGRNSTGQIIAVYGVN